MKYLKLFFLAALAVVLFSSCSKYEYDKKIAILLESGEIADRWNYDKAYLAEAISKYSDLQQVTYVAEDSKTQIQQLEEILKSGYKNIILTPIDYEKINESGLLEKYPNINVVCHSILLMNNAKVSYLSSCYVEEIGKLQAEYLIQHFLGSGKESMTLEMFAGPDGDFTSTHIYAGAYEVLKPFIENGSFIIKSKKEKFEEVSLPKWDRTVAGAEMKSRLAKYYPEGDLPDLILGPNDDCAIGIINAIDELHPVIERYPAITGQDNSEEGQQYLKNGKLGMTVDLSVKNMCYNTAMIISSIIQGVIPASTYSINNGVINVPLIKCDIHAVYSSK